VKTEHIRLQEWILHQVVNKAATKKQNKKAERKENKERQRVRTLDGEITEGKHCHSSDPREERTDPTFSIYYSRINAFRKVLSMWQQKKNTKM
jgi:hypothetical protein